MKEYVAIFLIAAAVIALDWIAFSGQYELSFLRTAEDLASIATNSVEGFISRNLRHG